MMFNLNTVAALSALFFASSAIAAPQALAKRASLANDIVFNPMVTSPKIGSVWQVGSTQIITWDTSMIPKGEENDSGTILLGYNENNSENLDVAHPLATGFRIGDGNVTVTVPDVIERDDYVVVLFGDSGNESAEFTISGGDVSATTVSFTDVSSATSSAALSSATAARF